jgi:hypothetical protein
MTASHHVESGYEIQIPVTLDRTEMSLWVKKRRYPLRGLSPLINPMLRALMIQPQGLFALGRHWIKKPNTLDKPASRLPTPVRDNN